MALLVTDWLAVLACLGSAWAVRGFVLPSLAPSFGALYPFSTYMVDLYFLLPWSVALAQEQLARLVAVNAGRGAQRIEVAPSELTEEGPRWERRHRVRQ